MARLLINTWLYRQPKKKKPKKVKKKSRLIKFAKALEINLPKSEQWFRSLYTPRRGDLFNEPYGFYIPDVINKRDLYIIEIDGSIHDLDEVKYKDFKKEQYYKSMYYKVFRVKAYDLKSFETFLKDLHTYLTT